MSEIELKLRSLPRSLNETYEAILSHVHDESVENAERAHLVLQWLVVSLRPMTLTELVEVLALRRGQFTINKDERLLDPRDVLDICPGLLNLEGDGTVSLAHFSVKEFLVSERSQSSSTSIFRVCSAKAHGILAEACLSYLLILGKRDPVLAFEHLQRRGISLQTLPDANDNRSYMLDEGNTESQHQENVRSRSCGTTTPATMHLFPDLPLANYAACFWPLHYHHASAGLHNNVFDVLVCKLLDRSLDFNFVNWLHASRTDLQDVSDLQNLEQFGVNKFNTPLFYAACLGLSTHVLSHLVKDGQNPGRCWSTLGEVLLQTVHDQDLETRSPLHAAATRGHKNVVEWLLPQIDDIHLLDHKGMAPLHAAISGCQRVVHYLIENGADINYGGLMDRDSPMQQAVECGDLTIVKLLLKHGASVTHPSSNFSGLKAAYGNVKPLVYIAARYNYLSVVETLLEHGADPNEQFGTTKSALGIAIRNGNQALFNLLLQHGADVNGEDELFGTPLAAACSAGEDAIATILLDHGALDWGDSDGLHLTAFVAAASRGNCSLVRRLLQTQPSEYRSGQRLNQALYVAAGRGHHEVVELVLAAGADANTVMDFENTEIWWMYGSDANAAMNFESTDFFYKYSAALMYAAAEGQAIVVEALIEHGADVNYRSSANGTALDCARKARQDTQVDQVQISLDEIIARLQHHGAVESSPLDHYLNPLLLNIPDHTTRPQINERTALLLSRNFPAPTKHAMARVATWFENNFDLFEDPSSIDDAAGSILEQLGLTGWINAACIAAWNKMNSASSVTACIEACAAQVVQLAAPEVDVSELVSNTLYILQVFQRGQEFQVDVILDLMTPLLLVLGGLLGLQTENVPTTELLGAIVMQMEEMGLARADNMMLIDLSRFMPLVEPLGVSRTAVELLGDIVAVNLFEHFDYSKTSSAEAGARFDPGRTGVTVKLKRNWFMMSRRMVIRTVITLLTLWLDHRIMLRLWFIGWLMAVTALCVKSLLLPLL